MRSFLLIQLLRQRGYEAYLDNIQVSVAITATSLQNLIDRLGVKTFVVDEETISGIDEANERPQSTSDPRNASFVIFTSGSTGNPKGIVIPHDAVCSSAAGYGKEMGIGPNSRVFQFSAYTFDVGVLDVLVTLIRGGCICIPSDEARINDLSGVINSTRANWAFLTPTVADLLSPAAVPGLKSLALGGEAISQRTADRWKDVLELHGAYGPAEASICAWRPNLGKTGKSTNIGQPISCAFWVVEATDPHRLVPVGCIGELLIEGPLLARGYLRPDEKNAAAFIDNVDWLPGNRSRRVYRSGDLVRRNHDGSFDYIGRKDYQVKLHGQRTELGEIELMMEDSLPKDMSGIVALINGESGTSDTLTALLWYTGGPSFWPSPISLVEDVPDGMKNLVAHVKSSLAMTLPRYMVPSAFLIFQGTPSRLSSGKIDRQSLISSANRTTTQERRRFSPAVSGIDTPTTSMEVRLRDLWASVLSLPVKEIGKNDNFLHLGGDSISAIQLVTLARQQGISLTVALVFRDPRLCQIAEAAVINDDISLDVEPFSLLPFAPSDQILEEIQQQCRLGKGQTIEDVYPCTKLQEGLMALAAKKPGSYIARNVFRLADGVDVIRFKLAWERTVDISANLRTRILFINGTSVQAQIEEEIQWEGTDGFDLKSYLASTHSVRVGNGSSLSRYALVAERYFVWTVHHAVFDGWSLQIIMNRFISIYRQTKVPEVGSFALFIKYTEELDSAAAEKYWSEQLLGAKRAMFPTAGSSKIERTKVTKNLKKTVPFKKPAGTSITTATVLRAAWAVVLARYCDTDDICFGTTVSGRQAPVLGLDKISGPMIATVPLRMRLLGQQPVADFLQEVQTQALDMISYEQFGLQSISKVNASAQDACEFSNLIAIQPMQSITGSDNAGDAIMAYVDTDQYDTHELIDGYFTYPLVIQIKVYEDEIGFDIFYDSEALSESRVEGLTCHFEHVARQLQKQDQTLLQDVSLAGSWDLQQAISWNSEDLSPVNVCVHDLIAKQACDFPDHEAVYSSKRSISYAELDGLSTRVASHLMSIGVCPEVIVPFCFEKSVWTIVTILGILKAGGAFMPLDPAHPFTYRQGLVQQVGAEIMLVSPKTASLCENMAQNVIEVSGRSSFLQSTTHASGTELQYPKPRPSNAAYVLFSSGSTGTPKGIVVEHAAFAASLKGHGKRFGIGTTSRVLQFSNYVFDVSVSEVISTLALGGTVCVPSDTERLQDTARFITESRSNMTTMTPSFIRTFSPDQVPTLKTLVAGGEPLTRDIMEIWADALTFFNAYGPAESTVYSTSHLFTHSKDAAATIGRGINNAVWIVDLENPNRLAPIGCAGELVLQGPAIARGYINDPKRTEQSFFDSAEFLPPDIVRQAPRFYRTGDLVRYDSNGNLVYIGRRDAQVKLRGQRMEPEDIEFKIKRAGADIAYAVVDVLRQRSLEALVAFVSFTGHDSKGRATMPRLEASNEVLRKYFLNLSKKMSAVLPGHMVPTYYISVEHMPQTSSGKIDRKALREQAQLLSPEELLTYAISQDSLFRDSSNETETGVRALWSKVLNLEAESIGVDDNFYDIGGDSIRIVTLTKYIHQQFDVQLGLSVLNSRSTTVATMAALIASQSPDAPELNLLDEISSITDAPWVGTIGSPSFRSTTSLPGDATVFLTGATGYLGTQLLRQLLRSDRIKRVVALVRAISPSQGLERVIKTARITGWWQKSDLEKLEVWKGDLEAKQLGLDDAHWSRLCGKAVKANVDAIIHNGAVVNWNANYEKLRKANVQSTKELLMATIESPSTPKFAFVSGGAKVHIGANRTDAAAEMAKNIGYSQTKFVSESAVYDIARQLPGSQNRLSVVKPGLIIGTSEEGIANIDDFLWRVVSTAADLRIYPSEPGNSWISITDVGSVAGTILNQLFSSDIDPFVDMVTGLAASTFWNLVNSELEAPCAPVAWDVWKERALKDMNQTGEEHPLWPVQHFLGGLGVSSRPEMPSSDESRLHLAVRKNVQYLLRIGYIRSQAGKTVGLHEDVIRRSNTARGG